MTVTDLRKDLAAAALTVEAEYPSSAERVWELWADPRLLERWWGPPSHPATVTDHDLSPGGTVRYYMTGPEGQQYHGGWHVVAVDPPSRLEFEDFFADADGVENPDLPRSRTVVTVVAGGAGTTRMIIETQYPSTDAMQQALEMGMEEGIKLALGQADDLLAAQPA